MIKKILRSRDKRVSVKGGTLLSSRETFEAGFFRLAATEGWFSGIWYNNVPERTYVWVGNRQYPLHSSNGNLEIYDVGYRNQVYRSTSLIV